MKTAIIFGINGQDGYYLKKLLIEKKIKVIGVSRGEGDWIKADVSDYSFVKKIIAETKPDYIFHLAANSTTRHEVWLENHKTICDGSLYILESVKEFSKHCKVFISGSGLQFKNEGSPIKETDSFNASSQYALSRIHSAYAARYYRSLGLKVYVGYFFHHESPKRNSGHISRIIVDFVKSINTNSDKKLEFGDISVEKEWTFAGDIVEAIYILVSQEKTFEAVLGSGIKFPISKWLDLCFSSIEKDWKDYVVFKNEFTPEFKMLYSDPKTIKSLGWEPKVSIEQLATIMLKN